MAKSERKQREFERREQDIIDAAYALFREQDYTTVTIEQIADKAGVGKGTIYKHFQSKEEICARIIINLNKAAYKDVELIGNDPTLDFRQRLQKLSEYNWDINMREEGFLSKLIAQMMRGDFFHKLSPEVRENYMAIGLRQQNLLLQLVEKAITDGDILPMSPTSALNCISAAMDGAMYRAWLLKASGSDISQLRQAYITELTDFIYRGISAKK